MWNFPVSRQSSGLRSHCRGSVRNIWREMETISVRVCLLLTDTHASLLCSAPLIPDLSNCASVRTMKDHLDSQLNDHSSIHTPLSVPGFRPRMTIYCGLPAVGDGAIGAIYNRGINLSLWTALAFPVTPRPYLNCFTTARIIYLLRRIIYLACDIADLWALISTHKVS